MLLFPTMTKLPVVTIQLKQTPRILNKITSNRHDLVSKFKEINKKKQKVKMDCERLKLRGKYDDDF